VLGGEDGKHYTVDESGQEVEQSEEEYNDLVNYGKKRDKAEEVRYQIKKVNENLTFGKILQAPDSVVLDFYGHLDWLAFDLPEGWSEGGRALFSGIVLEFGTGYPPIPGDNRMNYDDLTIAFCAGYKYPFSSQSGPSFWEGKLISNPRSFGVYMAGEGYAMAKHAKIIMDYQPNKKLYDPGYAALKAMSGQTWSKISGEWPKWIQKIYTEKEKRIERDFSSWGSCVRTLMLEDLIDKRVPRRHAFEKIRLVPELAEPVFEEVLSSGEATQVMKRNMATLLEKFISFKGAKMLHELARDTDAVTALRALNSLTGHPHGKTRTLLEEWLEQEEDDVKRAKAMLLSGRTGDAGFAKHLRDLWPKARDDYERELIVRGLMRLRDAKAKEIFEEAGKSKDEMLSYSAELGLFAIGAISEEKMLPKFKKIFGMFTVDEGEIFSMSPKLRFDIINLICSKELPKLQRWLWLLLKNFKDLGPRIEQGGVSHLMAHALYEMPLGTEVVPKSEAVKVLNIILHKSSNNVQIRLAALTRLYEFDTKKAVAFSKKLLERFLKGRKVAKNRDNKFNITEIDLMSAGVNLLLIDQAEDEKLVERIMQHKNIPGDVKTRFLEYLYKIKPKRSRKIVKKSLKYYLALFNKSKTDLSSGDERYLMRLIRFAGTLRDKNICEELNKLMVKSSNQWLRFMCLYSLRNALNADIYGDVIKAKKADRQKVATAFAAKIREL
jgi:hypothetical protein